MQPKFYGARPPSIRKNQTRSSPSNQRVNPCSDITVYPAWNLSREAARTSAAMAPSFPDSDCDTSFESCCSSTIALSSNGHHLYASDTSSNLSCSSSGTDTSGSSTRRSSWERSVSVGSCGSKPHKAHDAAWTAIRGLRLREGNVGISHFKLLRKAGQGDIGCVYLSQLRGTPCIFAMKVMDKDALGYRNKVHRMHTEREILGFVDHPFLPTLYAHFETEQFSCLVMEFCPGGDLHALRQRQPGKRFSLKAARFYAAEVLVALEYLHMMGVVYRDLKPENVLVREDGHIMLSDFDLSLKCEVQPMLLRLPTRQSSRRRRPSIASDASHNPASCTLPSCVSPCTIHPMISCLPVGHRKRPQPSVIASTTSESAAPVQLPHAPEFSTPELVAEPTQARSMSFVGTHEYLAPEIIAGHGHGSAVDWWTFGIFLYELLIGRTPFKGSNNDFTLMNIIKQPLRFPEDLELEVGEAARSLIHGLLVKDPRKRMASMRGAAEIKKHPFFRGVNWALIRCATPPEVPKTHFLDPATKRSYQNVANRVTAPINSLLCEEKRKIWNVNRIVSDSSPDFEYF